MARQLRVRLLLPLSVAIATAEWGAARADIAAWIDQLDAPQFARREAASRSLAGAGADAIEPLERAIAVGDLEVSSRGIDILRQMLETGDEALSTAAEASLGRLETAAEEPVGRLAAAALEFHRLGRSTAARERLESLGATLRERPVLEGRGLEVEIASGWRGEPADLRLVAGLQRLAAVSIHGVTVDAATVEMLGRLAGVQRIELFGTGAGEDDAKRLATRLPEARIDVRRGGRLGVSAAAPAGPCEIRTVEPGSAADQSGLRSGDVILAIDGEAVASFDELTTRLGERSPGERIRLTVARRGGTADGEPERIECDVRLDAW